ncbi:MAG TPA: VIT domain-containing protein [Planctomycetota bacterium]|nr:VIT domain-containing protein [Planctomycetota bacterium]
MGKRFVGAGALGALAAVLLAGWAGCYSQEAPLERSAASGQAQKAPSSSASAPPPAAPVAGLAPGTEVLVIERDEDVSREQAPAIPSRAAAQARYRGRGGPVAGNKGAGRFVGGSKKDKAAAGGGMPASSGEDGDRGEAGATGGGAEDDGGGAGALLARDRDGKAQGRFPLEHTDVAAEVAGFLASTRVTQTFGNPFQAPIEAVYVFPLPETAAVNDFLMAIGPRRIRGVVRPRAEAERIYAEARAQGYTASLLTEERANIFTQSVANIAPGSEVKIEITYFHTLRYERGEYTYVFPMVVGPRYIPPGAGRVPDAAKISPPVLKPGERSGHDIGVGVALEAGVPLRDVQCPTHAGRIEREGASHATVTLEDSDAIPNRDLVLRWRVARDATEVGFLAHRGDEGGYFSLLVEPPLDPREADVTPREITFLLDISGSQQGVPLEMSKEIVLRCLDRLRAQDRFNVMYFESGNGQLFEEPVANTPENVEAAKEFTKSLQGGGGTNMLEGLARALHAKRDPRYLGMVVFCTDGYIGNDAEILRLVKEERGDTRVFVFGTGSGVNRALLEGIAEHGAGKVEYALPRDQAYAERCVDSFFSAIDAPVLCDVSVDWGGLPVADVYPRKLPDLFTGQPIVLKGRFTGPGKGTITVRGRVGARRVAYPLGIELPAADARFAALGPVWARARIADLEDQMLTAAPARQGELEKSITGLACEFRLVSPFTAFTAVDDSRVVSRDGKPARVDQPVELPEHVSYEGAVGGK